MPDTLNDLMFTYYKGAITANGSIKVAGTDGSNPASTSNPLPVRTVGAVGTDRSITATTTSAQLMTTNSARVRFFVKNDSAVDVWINLGATAVGVAGSGNIRITANGGYFELAGYTGAVNIIAASGTAAITARDF